MVYDLPEGGEPAVVIEAALRVRPQALQRRRAVAPVGGPVGLEAVYADLLRGMHVPAGLGVKRRDVAARAACVPLEERLAALRRSEVEAALRRARRGQAHLVVMQRWQLGGDQVRGLAHVAETRRSGDRELCGVVQARIVEGALALHLEVGD